MTFVFPTQTLHALVKQIQENGPQLPDDQWVWFMHGDIITPDTLCTVPTFMGRSDAEIESIRSALTEAGFHTVLQISDLVWFLNRHLKKHERLDLTELSALLTAYRDWPYWPFDEQGTGA